jgi:5-methylcytosine-specific restriction endonuclease McrA
MKNLSFIKGITPTNMGLTKSHLKGSIVVPKRQVDCAVFFNPGFGRNYLFYDKILNRSFEFYVVQNLSKKNDEVRITLMFEYFILKNATVNDNIYVKKVDFGDNVFFEIDLLRKGFSTTYAPYTYFSDEEKEKSDEDYYEGTKIKILVNKFERDTKARGKCIEHYGAVCTACKFDFKEKYGDIGKGFIHVHHKVPLSEIGKSYKVDPINDLIPVCPNCHSMIHKRKPKPFTIDDIKKKLKK